MANTLSTAATAPFAGAISDLLGRRYVALLGSGLVIIGVSITGSAQRMAVAIGGMAIVGVGAGLAEVIAAAGIMELAPVRHRGLYVGISFLLYLPIAAGQMYGLILSAFPAKFSSSIILKVIDMAMGCLDLGDTSRRQLCYGLSILSSTAETQCLGPYKEASILADRLRWRRFVC
jgi:MFS family permease